MVRQASAKREENRYDPVISYAAIEQCQKNGLFDDETIGVQLEEFWKSENWSHDFCAEARALRVDDEASYLSKRTFAKLFDYLRTLYPANFAMDDPDDLDYEAVSQLSMRPSKKNKGYAESLLFHFDVMNNPNTYKRSSIYRIGSLAARQKPPIDELTFKKNYHTIGNFTPIPWWIENTYARRQTYGLQTFHASLAEWWDALLVYLQWRMPEFEKTSGMSFDDYIILTCQFFYIDINDEHLEQLHKKEQSVEDFCARFEGDSSETTWTIQVKDWIKKIKESKPKNLQIISLAESTEEKIENMTSIDSIGKVKSDETQGQAFKKDYFNQHVIPVLNKLEKNSGQIDFIDKHIGRLIEARGRCILGLLKEAHEA